MTCEHKEELDDLIAEARDIMMDEDGHDRLMQFVWNVAEYYEPLKEEE